MKLNKYIAFPALCLLLLSGCKDEKLVIDPEHPSDILDEQFGCTGAFYDLSIPGALGWTIEAEPDWATPAEDSGDAGSKINLYVESNLEDTDRNGTLSVRLSDGSIIEYSLHQYSSISDDNNAIVNETTLNYTRGVGYGIDVFEDPQLGTSKYATKREVINPNKLLKYLKGIGEQDAYVEENRYYSESSSFVGSSVSTVSNQLSVSAGVEAEFGAFKGSVSAAFGGASTVNENTGYAMKEIKHVVGSRYMRQGVLRDAADKGADIFTTSFTNGIKKINGSTSDDELFKFIDNFGTHLIVYGELGGTMQLCLEMHSTEKVTERTIAAALEITAGKAVSGGVNVDISEQTKSFAKDSKISFRSYGGTNILNPIQPGTSFETAMTSVITKDNLEDFVKGLTDETKSSATLIDVKLIPLYSLIPDPAGAERMHDYLLNTYQFDKTDHRSLKYAVSGFHDKVDMWGELYIPEIDTRLEYYSEDVPEISTSERSTIIYSGNSYEMSYDVGFFIGSDSKAPGKLRKMRDGSFRYEPFDLPASPISEVYVDATGDVKIAPSSKLEDYVSMKFESEEISKGYIFSPDISQVYIEDYGIGSIYDQMYESTPNSFTRFIVPYSSGGRLFYRSPNFDEKFNKEHDLKTGKAYINFVLKSDVRENLVADYKIDYKSIETSAWRQLLFNRSTVDQSIVYENGKYKLHLKRVFVELNLPYQSYECFGITVAGRTFSSNDTPFGLNKDNSPVWPEIYLSYEGNLHGITTPRWR